MEVFCDTYSLASISPPLIPGQQGKVVVISSITIQNESTTDTTAILYSGGVAKRRICMPNKGDGYDRVYAKNRELVSELGQGFQINQSAAAQLGITIEWMYR